MKKLALVVAAVVFGGTAAFVPAWAQDKAQEKPPAAASEEGQIVAEISVSGQRMTVRVDGVVRYVWVISTARRGYVTPHGSFRVQSMHKMTYSRLFNNAPMPWSIFYSGHYAIHGTTDIARLGQPASAGCVRLHPDNARILFEMVQERGKESLRVEVGA